MRPNKAKKKKKKKNEKNEIKEEKLGEIEMKKQLFPGLALADNPDVRVGFYITSILKFKNFIFQ